MKLNGFLTLAGVLAIVLFVTGCDLSLQPSENAGKKGGAAPKAQTQKPPQSKPQVHVQPKPQQQVQHSQPQAQPQKRSVADDVNSVVNYGIGATQLKAKQNMQNKIQNIQQRKNKEMEDALK